jgi:serine/threonine protein phosphatase 1
LPTLFSFKTGALWLSSALFFPKIGDLRSRPHMNEMQPSSARLIAIGDIHGSLPALDAILEKISPTKTDTVVALGDYVDRGDHSKGVIDRLLELQNYCRLIPLRGNHEEMMESVVLRGGPPHAWLRYGGVDTLDSYGFSGDLGVVPESHRAFLAGLHDWFELDKDFFVHANYEPDVPLSKQEPEILRWTSLNQFMPGPHMSGKRAVVGHTAARDGEIFDVGYLVCLDTHIYGGGWLTAMDLSTGQLWQANQQGNIR